MVMNWLYVLAPMLPSTPANLEALKMLVPVNADFVAVTEGFAKPFDVEENYEGSYLFLMLTSKSLHIVEVKDKFVLGPLSERACLALIARGISAESARRKVEYRGGMVSQYDGDIRHSESVRTSQITNIGFISDSSGAMSGRYRANFEIQVGKMGILKWTVSGTPWKMQSADEGLEAFAVELATQSNKWRNRLSRLFS